jgi:hypothetical protein
MHKKMILNYREDDYFEKYKQKQKSLAKTSTIDGQKVR